MDTKSVTQRAVSLSAHHHASDDSLNTGTRSTLAITVPRGVGPSGSSRPGAAAVLPARGRVQALRYFGSSEGAVRGILSWGGSSWKGI